MNEVYYKPQHGFGYPGSIFYRIHRRLDNGLFAVISNLDMRVNQHNNQNKYVFVRDSKGEIFSFASKKKATKYLRLWFSENQIDFEQRPPPIISDELLAKSFETHNDEEHQIGDDEDKEHDVLPIPKRRRTFYPSQVCLC